MKKEPFNSSKYIYGVHDLIEKDEL